RRGRNKLTCLWSACCGPIGRMCWRPSPSRSGDMKAIGWEEGRNIRFQFAWMGGHNERATELAGELIAQKVDLIITFGDPAIRATQRATQAIPIIGMSDDMIGSGL